MELKLVRFLFFIVQVLLLIHLTTAREDEIQLNVDLNIDRSNYVDPFDMLNYDPRLGSTEKTNDLPNEKVKSSVSSSEDRLKSELIEDQKHLKRDDVTPEATNTPSVFKLKQNKKEKSKDNAPACPSITTPASIEKPFLGRFIKILANTLQLEVSNIAT